MQLNNCKAIKLSPYVPNCCYLMKCATRLPHCKYVKKLSEISEQKKI